MYFDMLVIGLGILSAFYAISYANYELKNKKTVSAIIIYIIALTGLFLSVYQKLTIN